MEERKKSSLPHDIIAQEDGKVAIHLTDEDHGNHQCPEPEIKNWKGELDLLGSYLEFADTKDWLTTGCAGTLYGESAVLHLDLLRVLDLPILLLLVDAIALNQGFFPRSACVEIDIYTLGNGVKIKVLSENRDCLRLGNRRGESLLSEKHL